MLLNYDLTSSPFDIRWQICHHLTMSRNTQKTVSWIKAAQKDFESFPQSLQVDIRSALTVVADNRMPDVCKPMKGLGSGVFEIAMRYRTDAYRVVYAVQIEDTI